MGIKNIRQIKNLRGSRILVRADFNVPIKNGQVAEDFKIQKSLPTIEYLVERGARVIIISHLGRPVGKQKKYSLRPVAKRLQVLLGRKVAFKTLEMAEKETRAEVTMLENIRFYESEEANDKNFARRLAKLADVFVLDGFAVAHRKAASVSGVAKFLPAYAGLLLEEEIVGLNKVLFKPKKPLLLLIGGVKMETKIPVIENFLKRADYILLTGGISNTYLLAKKNIMGSSALDAQYKSKAIQYSKNKKVIMPIDAVVGNCNGKDARVIRLDKKFKLKKGEGIFDVGPATVNLFAKYIKKAHTIIWNGAPGYFEQPPYQHGTFALTRLLAARSRGRAFGVCGGGETVEILQKLHILDEIDLVSTGGGAMLEYLSGKKLPGIEALKQ